MSLRLVPMLLAIIGCAKSPSVNSPIALAQKSTPAPGQQSVDTLICASEAFNDIHKRVTSPIVYRTKLIDSGSSSSFPITLSTEPAYKRDLSKTHAKSVGDDFLERSDYLMTGSWDGEQISLLADNLSLKLNRSPGQTAVFYVGQIELTNEQHVQFSCWEPEARNDFLYDLNSGKCVDKNSEPGLNKWTLAYIRDNANGECSDLGHVQINEGNYEYPTFSWNLKGANLSNIDMVFSTFSDSQFEGANLIGMTIGYATISGTKDVHTQLPEELCRSTSETTFTCEQ
jgi:hypothetical protein